LSEVEFEVCTYLLWLQTFRNTLLFLLVKSGSRKQSIEATAEDDFSGQFGVLVKLEINRISIVNFSQQRLKNHFWSFHVLIYEWKSCVSHFPLFTCCFRERKKISFPKRVFSLFFVLKVLKMNLLKSSIVRKKLRLIYRVTQIKFDYSNGCNWKLSISNTFWLYQHMVNNAYLWSHSHLKKQILTWVTL